MMHASTFALSLALALPLFAQSPSQLPPYMPAPPAQPIPVLPDLEIVATTGPASIQAGKVIEVSARVRNIGSDASAKTFVGIFLSADDQLDAGDPIVQRMAIPALQPGEGIKGITFAFIPFCAPAALQNLIFVVDPLQQTRDVFRPNNAAVRKQPLRIYQGDGRHVELHPSLEGPGMTTHWARIDLSSQHRSLEMCLTARKLAGAHYLLYWSASQDGSYDPYTELGLQLIGTKGFATWLGQLDAAGHAYPVAELPKIDVAKGFTLYTFALFFGPGLPAPVAGDSKAQLIFEATR